MGERLVDDFTPRGAALEYWFVKVADGDLSFLVDWILRRGRGLGEVRVSLWVHERGRVLHTTETGWREDDRSVTLSGCRLSGDRAAGTVDDVSWELQIDPGGTYLDPVPWPAKVLSPFDMQLVGRPRATFDGTVQVAGRVFTLRSAPGTFTHYWGRRLPDQWLWVSAGGLDGGAGIVEALALRTRVWGMPRPVLTGGYVLVDDGERSVQVVAPGYGRITTSRGADGSHVVRAHTRGRTLALTAHAPPALCNDLGEGISQTLLGSVTIDGWGSAARAGVETRGDWA